MARPKGGYYSQDGTRVPGCTTVTGRFKDSGGLIHWAWNLGYNEHKDYRDERDKAADAGTAVHEMVEAHAAGEDPFHRLEMLEVDDPYVIQGARTGFQAYREWADTTKIEIVEQEIPLVSEKFRFGGTPDAIGYCNGKLSLLDWKSGRIYVEAVIQVSAYGKGLWAENRPEDVLESYHLCRFNKDTGGFSHNMIPMDVINIGWEQFKLLRQAYELDKKIKKAVQ